MVSIQTFGWYCEARNMKQLGFTLLHGSEHMRYYMLIDGCYEFNGASYDAHDPVDDGEQNY